jgi:tol-pal system protein YbgF
MTEDVTVTRLLIKPALLAGFLLASIPLGVLAQGYIDVEAERRAAKGEEDRPTDAQAVSSEQAYSGIRPYSGSTIVAQPPLESVRQPETGTDQGSLILRIQRLEADVRRLNGLLEEATQALQQLESQSLERYVEIDRRLSVGALEVGSDTALSGSIGVPDAQPSGAPARQVSAQAGEEPAYQAAYALVREREFEAAVTAFMTFLSDFPFGRYAPNAHYWLGELYLVLDPPDPELARQNFKLLLDQYPEDPKVPDALYKLGRVQFIKGNRQRAQEYLDEVIREYPSHAAAQLARQFLLENF